MYAQEDTEYDHIDDYIKRIAENDMDAFQLLYQQSSNGVFALALSILKNRAEAEDVMQDTFLKVRSAAHLYEANGKGKAWIMMICRNLCLMRIRKTKFTSFNSVEDYENDFFTTMGDIEDQIVLKTAMETLSTEESEIVILHVVSGLKHKEIAEMFHLTLSTVLSKYNRALKKLKKELEGKL